MVPLEAVGGEFSYLVAGGLGPSEGKGTSRVLTLRRLKLKLACRWPGGHLWLQPLYGSPTAFWLMGENPSDA